MRTIKIEKWQKIIIGVCVFMLYMTFPLLSEVNAEIIVINQPLSDMYVSYMDFVEMDSKCIEDNFKLQLKIKKLEFEKNDINAYLDYIENNKKQWQIVGIISLFTCLFVCGVLLSVIINGR